MFSCNNEVDLINNETKIPDTEILEMSNEVTLDEIQNYMENGSPIASRNGGNGKIEVITYENDTVMYLLNYSNGWEMMPGDKRFPLQVAYNDEGTLDYANMHDAQRAWFDNMAKEISFMKKHGKNYENEYNKVWKAFSKRNKKKGPKSRGENGEWIYHNTRETSSVTEKPHLITTLWHQGRHNISTSSALEYNKYCPINSNRTFHKPVGCTAVAGGQVLNYLYQKGWSLTNVPNIATPNADMSEYSFTSPSTSVWNEIRNNNVDAIAKLLGHVGILSGMRYGDESSGATVTTELIKAFNHYGVGYDTEDFWDTTIIWNNLKSNLPVIVSMAGKKPNNQSVAHSLIIDGFRNVITTYTDVYIYVENPNNYPGDIYDHDSSGNPVPAEGPTQEETYTTNTIYYYLNWGYSTADNTCYLASSHISRSYYDTDTYQTYQIVFNDQKKMMYNLFDK